MKEFVYKPFNLLITLGMSALILQGCSTPASTSAVPEALAGIGFPADFKAALEYEATSTEWIGYAYSSGPDSAYAARTALELALHRAVIAMDEELEAARTNLIKEKPELEETLSKPDFIVALRGFSSSQFDAVKKGEAATVSEGTGQQSGAHSQAGADEKAGATSKTGAVAHKDAWVGYATLRIGKAEIKERLSRENTLWEYLMQSPVIATW